MKFQFSVRDLLLIIAVVALAGRSSPSKASFISGQIDMDFNNAQQPSTQTGKAVIGAAGDVWNQELSIAAHTTDVLTLTNGNTSNGVTLSIGGVSGAFSGGGTFLSTPYAPLMNDGFFVTPGDTMVFTFNGLTPLFPYQIFLYSAGPNNDNVTLVNNGKFSQGIFNHDSLSGFAQGSNFIIVSPLAADATGQFSITVQGSGGSNGIVNGFQFVPAAEPATLALAAVGLASFLALRSISRRKSNELHAIGFLPFKDNLPCDSASPPRLALADCGRGAGCGVVG